MSKILTTKFLGKSFIAFLLLIFSSVLGYGIYSNVHVKPYEGKTPNHNTCENTSSAKLLEKCIEDPSVVVVGNPNMVWLLAPIFGTLFYIRKKRGKKGV